MKYVVWLIFFLCTTLIFRPLLAPVWYPMHDSTHVARTYLLQKSLAEGQFPAIWAGELNDGKGYPLFQFYAPLTYYLALTFSALTHSYFTGLKITLILASLLAGSGMYLLARKWGRAAGLLATISYLFLPYAAVNLYVRGAFAEYLSMGLLPWTFFVWENLTTRKRQIGAAVVTTLFLLSHNLIPFMAAPFFLMWILMHHTRKITVLVVPVVLTLALSAFYLAPLVFERNFVQADQVAMTTQYADHFVAPTQLWNSVWGFGGSAPGLADGMSFKVGKIQIILASLAALYGLIRRKKMSTFLAVAALISAYMTTSYSSIVWQHMPYLPIVQFPWRYLVLTGFFISFLSGYLLTSIRVPPFRALALLVMSVALLFINLKYFTPQTTFRAHVEQFTNNEYLQTLPSIIPEYRPVWLNQTIAPSSDETILPHYYYPNWQVQVAGRTVMTHPTTGGMLATAKIKDEADIQIVMGHTPLETIALLITLCGILASIGLYVKK